MCVCERKSHVKGKAHVRIATQTSGLHQHYKYVRESVTESRIGLFAVFFYVEVMVVRWSRIGSAHHLSSLNASNIRDRTMNKMYLAFYDFITFMLIRAYLSIREPHKIVHKILDNSKKILINK